jgi:hypothetical protein
MHCPYLAGAFPAARGQHEEYKDIDLNLLTWVIRLYFQAIT